MCQKSTRKCAWSRCGRSARFQKTLCARCEVRSSKKHNPVKYHFNALRSNAKRRGKVFTLTIDQYLAIWVNSGKWDGKKEKPMGYELDRIDPSKGYEMGNVQVLHKVVHIEKNIQERNWNIRVSSLSFGYCPF